MVSFEDILDIEYLVLNKQFRSEELTHDVEELNSVLASDLKRAAFPHTPMVFIGSDLIVSSNAIELPAETLTVEQKRALWRNMIGLEA